MIPDVRRRRLFEHLLIAALHRAVAGAQRPKRAVLIAQDLNLDVARLGNERLHEQGRIAERRGGLGVGRPERAFELFDASHQANAAPSAARRGLEQDRKADALRMRLAPLRATVKGPPDHGETGTFSCSAICLAAILSPMSRMT